MHRAKESRQRSHDYQTYIVLEDAFQGDDELKTNLAQLAKSKGIEFWTA